MRVCPLEVLLRRAPSNTIRVAFGHSAYVQESCRDCDLISWKQIAKAGHSDSRLVPTNTNARGRCSHKNFERIASSEVSYCRDRAQKFRKSKGESKGDQ